MHVQGYKVPVIILRATLSEKKTTIDAKKDHFSERFISVNDSLTKALMVGPVHPAASDQLRLNSL